MDIRSSYRVLVWNPEGKRQLGKTLRKWKDRCIFMKWDGKQ
jgi:hypothetical protein